MLLKSNLRDYPGSTNDERVEVFLKEAKQFNFHIIPFIDKDNEKRAYSIFKEIDTTISGVCLQGQEESYCVYADNWINGFPKDKNME